MAFTRKSKNPVRYEYPGGRDLETQQLLPELLWNILFPVNAGRLPASWLASVQANALLIISSEVKSRPLVSEDEPRILENLAIQETLLVFDCATLHAMLVFIHIVTQEVFSVIQPVIN